MKKCFKCQEVKSLDNFYTHPQMADGHLNKCKSCAKTDVKTHYSANITEKRLYDKLRQRHSFERIFRHRYSLLKQRSEGRAIRPYGVRGKPLISKEQFLEWCNDNIDEFTKLHKEWERSDFSRGLTPSIDRIDNNGSYTRDNIRWITVTENSKKFTKELST